MWGLFDNRIRKLDDKGQSIGSSLASATCRLNKDESLIKLCENKQLILQNVLQDDSKPVNTSVKEELPKPKSLAEYVHESVQNGLKLVDQKQICVEVHSDMTDDTLKVFEDMNPYLIRDLPPLIGSREFETGNFVKQQTKNAVSPVDDVIIELPQPITTKNIPNIKIPTTTIMNGNVTSAAPPPPPPPPPLSQAATPPQQIKQPSPTATPIVHNEVEKKPKEAPRRGPIIITPTTPAPSSSIVNGDLPINTSKSAVIKEIKAQPNPITREEPMIQENNIVADTKQTNHVTVNSRAPPNLAEIIKNTPPLTKIEEPKKKKQNMSLFTDDDEEEDDDKPIAKVNVTNKQPMNNHKQQSETEKIKPPPRTIIPASTPQPPSRTKLPTSQPEAPPRKTSNVSTEKKLPLPVQKMPKTKPQTSLFSSSDEEDDAHPISKVTKPQTKTAAVKEPVQQSKPIAPKRGKMSNTVDKPSSSKSIKHETNDSSMASTSSKNVKKQPNNTNSKAKSLFDDSDDDDDFFSKPPQKSVAEKDIPKQQQPQQPIKKASAATKTVRKSMFSSSDSE